MALDDKLYQRDLEVALALSVKEHPTVTTEVRTSQDRSIEKYGSSETETMKKSPHISNCSVTSDYLGLDTITEEDGVCGANRKRKAASKAQLQRRKTSWEGSDGDSAGDTDPDFASSELEPAETRTRRESSKTVLGAIYVIEALCWISGYADVRNTQDS